MAQKVKVILQEQLGNPASLPDGLLVTLCGPRRLLLLAGQHGPVDGDVLQGLALGARVGDLGLGDHAAPLGPDGARVVAAVGRGTHEPPVDVDVALVAAALGHRLDQLRAEAAEAGPQGEQVVEQVEQPFAQRPLVDRPDSNEIMKDTWPNFPDFLLHFLQGVPIPA